MKYLFIVLILFSNNDQDSLGVFNNGSVIKQLDTVSTNKLDTLFIKLDNIKNKSNDTPGYLLKIIVPILVVILTGFLALIQVRINSITNYKINQLEKLNENLSLYFSEIEKLNYYLKEVIALREEGTVDESKKKYSDSLEHFGNITKVSNQIRLSLDRNKAAHLKLDQSIKKLYNIAIENPKISLEILEKELETLLNDSRKLISSEWNDITSLNFFRIFKK